MTHVQRYRVLSLNMLLPAIMMVAIRASFYSILLVERMTGFVNHCEHARNVKQPQRAAGRVNMRTGLPW